MIFDMIRMATLDLADSNSLCFLGAWRGCVGVKQVLHRESKLPDHLQKVCIILVSMIDY